MAKLRHLAILTHQPDRLADFYKRVFEMNEMYRTKNGSVHLSDGEVNLAILNAADPKEPGHRPGLYHFGFHVEDNKRSPSVSRRFIRKARRNSARLPTLRVADRIPTETSSISPPSVGGSNGA